MRFALLILGIFLTACAASTATQPAAAPTDPFAALSQFTVTDLQNADAIAVANNDALGHACYPALIKFIQSLPSAAPGTTVSGAVSAFETARAARLKVQGTVSAGLPDYLKLGCSPLVLDEQTLLLKLGALGAGASVGVPIISATP